MLELDVSWPVVPEGYPGHINACPVVSRPVRKGCGGGGCHQ